MADGCGNLNFEASNNDIKVKTVGDERYDFSTFKKKTNTSRRSYRQRSLRQQQFGGSPLK